MFKFANCKRLLVGGFNLSEKYEFVSWDDSSQYDGKNHPVMFQSPPTSLPGRVPSPQPPPTIHRGATWMRRQRPRAKGFISHCVMWLRSVSRWSAWQILGAAAHGAWHGEETKGPGAGLGGTWKSPKTHMDLYDVCCPKNRLNSQKRIGW